jgi:hypothetical protein
MTLTIGFLGLAFGVGVATGLARIVWWLIPGLAAVFAVVLSVWMWIGVETCTGCEEGLGEAIALLVTVLLATAWTFGTAALAAGWAFGRRLRDGAQAPALFS